jgi:hypothetical protein
MRRGRLAQLFGGDPVGGGAGGVPYDQSGIAPEDMAGLPGAVPPGQGIAQPPVPDAPLGVGGDVPADPGIDAAGVPPAPDDGTVDPGADPGADMGLSPDSGALSNQDLGSMLDSTPEDALVGDMSSSLDDPAIQQELALAARRQLLQRGR